MPYLPKPDSRLALHTRSLLALLLLVLTVGCTPLREQVKPVASTWSAHRTAMLAIDNWQLKGKLAYRNDRDSASAWFDWSQRGDSFNIYLSGAFGVGTVNINGNAHGVTLKQAGRDDITSPSATGLTRRLFGEPLPVKQMRYWLKGIPASKSAITGFNEEGLLSTLQENGWTIHLSRYKTDSRGPLPSKLTGHSENLSFTLLLKDWSFADKAATRHIKPLKR